MLDEISHEAILGCLREKVMDNRFLALIHRLLKLWGEYRRRSPSHREGRAARRNRLTVVVKHGPEQAGLVPACTMSRQRKWLYRKAGRPAMCGSFVMQMIGVFITRSLQQHAERLRDRIRVP